MSIAVRSVGTAGGARKMGTNIKMGKKKTKKAPVLLALNDSNQSTPR